MKNKILNPLKFAKCYIIWHTAFHKDNDDLAKIASLGAGACEYLNQIERALCNDDLDAKEMLCKTMELINTFKLEIMEVIDIDEPQTEN